MSFKLPRPIFPRVGAATGGQLLKGLGLPLLAVTLIGCGATGLSETAPGTTPSNDAASTDADLTDADLTFEQSLAIHLQETGAVMYGAYWCPFCAEQKEMFGDAAAELPYVECDPEGENPEPERCAAQDLEGYPSWEIDGELHTGMLSLRELAELSGFED
jgi:thiol-disulfide isomerase/thioredoxin